MRQNPKTDPVSRPQDTQNSSLSLLIDMADATWRMFVPIVGLLMLGRQIDTRYGYKPWAMLAGAGLGSIIAYVLIKRLINKTSKE